MKTKIVLIALLSIGALAPTPASADQPITTIAPGARQIELDFDRETENYFAVVRGENGVRSYWVFYISPDYGGLWDSKASFGFTGGDYEDVDVAVVGDWVYVAEVTAGSAVARIYRFSAVDGIYDIAFDTSDIVNVSPATVVDVALASNRDGPDNQIYFAVIASDGTLRFFWDDADDGKTFVEDSPGISDACCGLDLTFNPQAATHDLFLSYFDTGSDLRVWRSNFWEEVLHVWQIDSRNRSRISAAGDEVVVCYELDLTGTGGYGIDVWRSYDAFDSYVFDVIAEPLPGGTNYYGCDVTARNGEGFAVTYTHEEGDFDPVYFRRHAGAPGDPWEDRVVVNETDAAVTTIFRTSLTWLPPNHYGVAFVESVSALPYFDRVASPSPIFTDGFESGDTAAWSATVP